MKFKKLFASVLAIALAVTAIPATSAKADVIEGSAAFLNTEVYKTVLPTTASQKFYLDPQGLSQVGQTGQAALPTGNKGQIVGKSTMAAINLSSRPVKMSVSYVLDVDAADMDVVSLANSGTAITNAADTVTKPAVCLTVEASVTSPAKAVTGASVLAAANTKSAFTATPYEFEAADYEAVTKAAFDANDLDELYNADNYEYKMVTTGASIELKIGGICLAQGDYSAFTGANAKSLNLDMTFKFTKDDGSDLGAIAYAPSEIQWSGTGAGSYGGFFLPNNTDPDAGSLEISFDEGVSYSALDASCYATYGTGWLSVYTVKANGGVAPAHAKIKYAINGVDYETVLY